MQNGIKTVFDLSTYNGMETKVSLSMRRTVTNNPWESKLGTVG